MSVTKLLVVGFLVFGVLVYVAVIAMCRAASRADRDGRTVVPPSEDVLVDIDGTVLRGFTPPYGMSTVRGVPTPRHGVTVPGPYRDERHGPQTDPQD